MSALMQVPWQSIKREWESVSPGQESRDDVSSIDGPGREREEIVLLEARCNGSFLPVLSLSFFLSFSLILFALSLPVCLLSALRFTNSSRSCRASNEANSLLMFLPLSLVHWAGQKSMEDCSMHLSVRERERERERKYIDESIRCTHGYRHQEEKVARPVHNLHRKKSSYLPASLSASVTGSVFILSHFLSTTAGEPLHLHPLPLLLQL